MTDRPATVTWRTPCNGSSQSAARTQRIAATARPSASSYYQLAQFAYAGNLIKEGDAAGAEAVRRTPKDLRNSVKAQVKDAKKQGKQIAKAVAQQKKAATKAEKGKPKGNAFGPLPGATGASGSGP